MRWPGHIEAGSICNDIVAHLDWMPTFAAIAGDADIAERLKKGTTLDGVKYKVHLDGYNMKPMLEGKGKSPRDRFFYFNDDAQLVSLRYDNWKIVFNEQRAQGTLLVWAEPFTELRVPKIFNLRTDPYEFADITSNSYYDWMLSRAYMLVPAQVIVSEFLATFAEFPPRQKAASFSLENVIEKMTQGASGAA
jgi:arylsulfatase